MGFVIQEIHAMVAIGDDGDEGVIGMRMNDGTRMPFIMADQERFEALLPKALDICRLSKKDLKILKFSVREDVTDKYIPDGQ